MITVVMLVYSICMTNSGTFSMVRNVVLFFSSPYWYSHIQILFSTVHSDDGVLLFFHEMTCLEMLFCNPSR